MLSSSGGSPALKRIYVRGTPILDSFRRSSYVVDCTGRFDSESPNPVRLRDGADHNLTGLQMATNLRAAAAATFPFSVTDEFGTYTALVEPDSFKLTRVKALEYRAAFTLRQVG